MWNWIRTQVDWWVFLVRRYWPIWLSGFLLVITLVPDVQLRAVSSLLVFAAAAAVFSDWRGALRDVRAEFPANVDADFEGLDLRRVEPGSAIVRMSSRGAAVVSDAVDEALRAGAETVVSWQHESYTLPPELSRLAVVALRHKREVRRTLFNGRVVRQDDDLTLDMTRGGVLTLRPGRYFDTECSNGLGGVEFRPSHWGGGTQLAPTELIALPDGQFRPLAESRLANAVGVNTLALTEDDYLVVVQQSRKNEGEGAGWLAPAGSGAMDPDDVRDGTDLLAAVVRGMERELIQEANLTKQLGRQTKVLGYARWLQKAGKPEFLGLSVLACRARDVPSRPRWSEKGLVARIECHPLDTSELRWDGVELHGIPRRLDGYMSMPLWLCLRAMAIALAEDADLVANLRRQLPAHGA